MKVYAATSGEYSDYRVRHIFAREEDARAYALGDDVEEFELREGPVEVRSWHTLRWDAGKPDRKAEGGLSAGNPWTYSQRRDFGGNAQHAEHEWAGNGLWLLVSGWDPHLVRKVYSEQRAQYEAAKAGLTQ